MKPKDLVLFYPRHIHRTQNKPNCSGIKTFITQRCKSAIEKQEVKNWKKVERAIDAHNREVLHQSPHKSLILQHFSFRAGADYENSA